MNERHFNFSAGPANLPLPVLEQAQRELLCLPGAGASVMEVSHRGGPFRAILDEAEANYRRLLSVPDNYRVLFLQGGSRLQFSMVPLNLLKGTGKSADYICTGSWTDKAIEEARNVGDVHVAWDGRETNYDRLPAAGELDLNADAAYAYFTSNETIQGVQFLDEPAVGDVPLICDASSDLLCRPLDIERYGLIYACAQKNCGPAGVTALIIRDDLLERSDPKLPGYLNYKNHADGGSLYNTAPTFAIYIVNLVANGGGGGHGGAGAGGAGGGGGVYNKGVATRGLSGGAGGAGGDHGVGGRGGDGGPGGDGESGGAGGGAFEVLALGRLDAYGQFLAQGSAGTNGEAGSPGSSGAEGTAGVAGVDGSPPQDPPDDYDWVNLGGWGGDGGDGGRGGSGGDGGAGGAGGGGAGGTIKLFGSVVAETGSTISTEGGTGGNDGGYGRLLVGDCTGPAILYDQYGWGARRFAPLRSVIKNRWTGTPGVRANGMMRKNRWTTSP